jgi:Flp pilus assembly protein TadG
MMRLGRKPFRKNIKGAALVEFCLVMVPLFHAFFGLIQVSLIYTANLMLHHAAVAAVRAYAVIHNQGGNNPGANGSEGDVTKAAKLALGPWNDVMKLDKVSGTSASNRSYPYGYYGLDTVELTATYKCSVPLGNTLVCKGTKRTFSAKASYPHQGARYK